jgi:DNA polymerase-1
MGQPKKFKQGQSPFSIVWPETPVQGPKDYEVLRSITDLEAYFTRCIEQGYASFDYEAAPSDAERARWETVEKDFKARRLQLEEEFKAKTGKDEKQQKALEKTYKARVALIDKDYAEALKYYEAAPLDPHRSKICTFSISAAPHEARAVFLDHKRGVNFMPELTRAEAVKLFFDTFERMILTNRSVMKIAYNLEYETKQSLIYDRYILAPVADPFIMLVRCIQMVRPDLIKFGDKPGNGKGLKEMTNIWLGYQMTPFKNTLEKGSARFFDEMDTEDPITKVYSCEDSDYGLQHYLYWDQIAKQIPCENDLYPTYSAWLHGIEMPFARVIGQMEYHGMMWNQEEADVKQDEAERMRAECSAEIVALIKENFNIDMNLGKAGKTNDMKDFIWNTLKLPVTNRSKQTGDASMDAVAIMDMIFLLENNLTTLADEPYLDPRLLPEDWENRDPETDRFMSIDQRMAIRIKRNPPHPYKELALQILELMQKQQKYATLLTSHIIGRQKYVNPYTGRIHCSYDQWQETARLAASKPNGQNVPRPDNDVFGIRNLYRAAPGKILLMIDYSGFELRLIAWKSGDKVMLAAFHNNEDLHYKTAATMTGKPVAEVTKHERSSAKAGNFGINYGGTAYALQKTLKKLGIRKSIAECDIIVSAVKSTYPGIPIYFVNIAEDARQKGYTETIYGFKRLLPMIYSFDKGVQGGAERQAANTPIQGSAADIMKKSQNAIYERIGADVVGLRYGWKTAEEAFMAEVAQIAQIHDECILELDDDPALVERVYSWAKSKMEEPPLPCFPLPLVAEGSVAYTWGAKTGAEKWLKEKGATA